MAELHAEISVRSNPPHSYKFIVQFY